MAEIKLIPMVNLSGKITFIEIPKRVTDELHKYNADATDAVIVREGKTDMLVKCEDRFFLVKKEEAGDS